MATITHQFNQDALDQLLADEQHRYLNAVDYIAPLAKDTVLGAIVEHVGTESGSYLDSYVALIAEGYTRQTALPATLTLGYYSTYLVKPVELQAADMAVLSAQVEAKYRATLKAAYDATVEKVVAESIARAERAEAKKAEAARVKLIAQATADAIASLPPLVLSNEA